MKIHYLQHVSFEGPANIALWAEQNGHQLTGTQLDNGERLPEPETFDFLVIMGGPMNIYQEAEFPWLREEKLFIKKAVEAGKAVLGICLGAQLLADVLGGQVTKNPVGEIGWLPINFTATAREGSLFAGFPAEATVFHWHNDTFSTLNDNALVTAYSAACRHQAFTYGERVVGLQFHMECSASSIGALVENCPDDLAQGGPYLQSAEEINAGESLYMEYANVLMDKLLHNLTKNLVKGEDRGADKLSTEDL